MIIEVTNQPVFKDHRGSFTPIKLSNKWTQSNISINNDIFVFRGIHFQYSPKSQTKLVSVVQGKIVDFIINLDITDSNFGSVQTFVLKEGESLTVPNKCGHGFLTLEENTIVNYLVDNEYSPLDEGCIIWSSISEVKEIIKKYLFGFNYEIIISEKDNKGITIEEFKNEQRLVG